MSAMWFFALAIACAIGGLVLVIAKDFARVNMPK
jgi:hypothetical protein